MRWWLLAPLGGCLLLSDPPPGVGGYVPVLQVVAGGRGQACARYEDGGIDCSGLSGEGPGPERYTDFDGDGGAYCGIREDRTLHCWGQDAHGVTAPPSGEFRWISVGKTHACAIDVHDELTCWGSNTDGQTEPPDGSYLRVDAGHWSACGIANGGGALRCWGDPLPGVPLPTEQYTHLAVGFDAGCAMRRSRELDCWGYDGSALYADAPEGVYGQIDGSDHLFCARNLLGSVTCWGSDDHDQDRPPDETFVQVGASETMACGATEDGRAVCWGQDAGEIDL